MGHSVHGIGILKNDLQIYAPAKNLTISDSGSLVSSESARILAVTTLSFSKLALRVSTLSRLECGGMISLSVFL